jgi:hypothetical protein
MTLRRSRVSVKLAPPIEKASLLSTKQLESQLRRAWLLNACFTCTQLASGFFVQKHQAANPSFTLDDLTMHIHQEAVKLAKAGRYVDQRLISPHTARKLAMGFLKYALCHNVVHPIRSQTWAPKVSSLVIEVPPGEVGYRQAPLAYGWNELQEMLSVSPLIAPSVQRIEV